MSKDFGQVESWFAYEAENVNGSLVTHFNGGDGKYVSYEDYKELLAAYKELKQSPAVAVPDGWKLVPIDPTPEMQSAALRHVVRQHQTRDVYREMLFASPNTASSPRITEQESFEIILSFYWFMENFINKNGRNPSVVEWYETEGRALLDKLNKGAV